MKKNTKKKFRDIRNAVVMMCVMIAMMSTASYAWFTMTSSPTVAGLQMTAATSGGALKVSNVDENGDEDATGFQAAITIKDSTVTKTLKPVTPNTTAGEFQSPVYTGNEVTSLSPVPAGDLEEKYVAKYTYLLKSDDTEDGSYVDIGIIVGDATANADTAMEVSAAYEPSLDGSLVRRSQKNPKETEINPAYAVRVGFVVRSGDAPADEIGKMYIWEPNYASEMTAATERAESTNIDLTINASAEAKSLVQSKETGSIVTGGSGNVSDKLFSVKKGGIVKIDMYVWIQGSDPQCGDEIQAGNLEAQVQFTAVGDAAEVTP